MTTTQTWSDTPPSENMKCWVRTKDNHSCEFVADWNGVWLHAGGVNMRPQHYQFGPAVLSAEETVNLTAEVERLRAAFSTLSCAMAAQIERERVAGERCGVSREQHGCDWPEWVADEVLKLRAAAAELAEIKRAWGMANSEI